MKYSEAVRYLAHAELHDDLLLLLVYRSGDSDRKGWDLWAQKVLSEKALKLLWPEGYKGGMAA